MPLANKNAATRRRRSTNPSAEAGTLFLASLPALPLIDNVTQTFGDIVTDPCHEFTVKPEIVPTLLEHKAADVLRILVLFINNGITCE
jgi:hypothetical protein